MGHGAAARTAKDVVQCHADRGSVEVLRTGSGVKRLSDVYAFAYRVPRFAATLPIEFVVEDVTVAGVTQNLSENGLLVRFASPVLRNTVGKLRLMVDTCVIEVEAEVTYAELFEAGLRFRFATPAEEQFIEMLVKVVSRDVSRESARRALRVPLLGPGKR